MKALMSIVVLTSAVLLQVPSLLTYTVVEAAKGNVIDDPVPNKVPVPFGPLYQLMIDPVPAIPPPALTLDEVLGHNLPGIEVTVGTVDIVLTTRLTELVP